MALVIDPVCGMTVDPAHAAGPSEYQGETIYFCSAGCKEKFDASPERYIADRPRREEAAIADAPPATAASPPEPPTQGG